MITSRKPNPVRRLFTSTPKPKPIGVAKPVGVAKPTRSLYRLNDSSRARLDDLLEFISHLGESETDSD